MDTEGLDPINGGQSANLECASLENKSQWPQSLGLSESPVSVWGRETCIGLLKIPRISAEVPVHLCPRSLGILSGTDDTGQVSVGAPDPRSPQKSLSAGSTLRRHFFSDTALCFSWSFYLLFFSFFLFFSFLHSLPPPNLATLCLGAHNSTPSQCLWAPDYPFVHIDNYLPPADWVSMDKAMTQGTARCAPRAVGFGLPDSFQLALQRPGVPPQEPAHTELTAERPVDGGLCSCVPRSAGCSRTRLSTSRPAASPDACSTLPAPPTQLRSLPPQSLPALDPQG